MKNEKTVGLFPLVGDCLHAGHVIALTEAKEHCDVLIAAVNSKPEGKNPVQTVLERVIQVKALKCVDEVLVYEGAKDLEKIALLGWYDIRFLGSDYKGKQWDGKTQEESVGIKPYFLERYHGWSSTSLKHRILSQYSEETSK